MNFIATLPAAAILVPPLYAVPTLPSGPGQITTAVEWLDPGRLLAAPTLT